MLGARHDAGVTQTRWWAATSPWNRAAAGAKVHPRSAEWIGRLAGAVDVIVMNTGAWTPTVHYAGATAPRGEVRLRDGRRIRGVPVPAGLAPSPDTDGHAVIVDRTNRRAYDFFRLARGADGGLDATVAYAFRLDGPGWRPASSGPWAARASGAALGGGLIRAAEVRAGMIPHALAAGIPGHLIGGHVRPATTSDGRGGPDGIPMGARLVLDPRLRIASLGLEPGEQVVARALQRYGAYVVDSSGSFALYAENSAVLARSPYPATWSNGITGGLIRHLRVVLPPG